MSDSETNRKSSSSSRVQDESKNETTVESESTADAFRKNNFLSLKDKAEILQRLDEGALATNLARQYGISKSTISRFKKRKETIQNAVTTIFPNNTDRRTMRGTFYKKTEAALYEWYKKQRQQNVEVTGSMLREKAQFFYDTFEESNYSFCASVGWLTKFKRRYGIKLAHSSSQSNEKPTLFEATKSSDDHLKTSKHSSHTVSHNVSQTETQNVDRKDAMRCIDTVIRWSTENTIDSLYLTMLRSLKNQIKMSPKVKYVSK
ncbi:tigger transposable element-derived protein 2-like [Sitodiplosis mosellana]|uniref:tigger transposable element-derived protein 2-like n=1 Tax=Sitodiplosis mosellana TaxID=263140 RepID=UPI002443F2B8|nr:tigger transposable element-derived protein 2-like [Sitodiplosis mosellana]